MGTRQAALGRVYDASYRRLVGQLYGVRGDLAEAEDVVQEAFERAVAQGRRFDRLDNPEAWLRTVAVNLARTRHRRRPPASARRSPCTTWPTCRSTRWRRRSTSRSAP